MLAPICSAGSALALAVFACVQHSSGPRHLGVDRSLAGAAADARDCGRLVLPGLLSLQLLNPAFRTPKPPSPRDVDHVAEAGDCEPVQRWLPPGLAALKLQQGVAGNLATALEAISLLGFYALAAGGILGVRLRAEYRGENLSDAPSRKKIERRRGTWLIDGSGPIAAVMEKELRTLLRAMPLIYGLLAPLLMVFLLSSVFIRRAWRQSGTRCRWDCSSVSRTRWLVFRRCSITTWVRKDREFRCSSSRLRPYAP